MGAHRGRLLSALKRREIAVFDIAYDGDSVLGEHRHDRAYVSVVALGSYTELRDGLPRRCTAGTAIFHAPGEVHADYFAAEGRCVNFEIDAGAPLRGESVLRTVASTHPQYEPAVRAALAERTKTTAAHDAPAWLRTVLAEFNWIEPVPLERASALAGVHPTHFVRAFRRFAGVTPGGYRRRERVRAASSLLLDSATPLSRIALACGFADQSHLSNVFREATGISPRRYRRAFTR
jgi:AraC-like DNA-binding protein